MLIWSLIALFLNYDLFVESSGENGYYAVCVKKKHFWLPNSKKTNQTKDLRNESTQTNERTANVVDSSSPIQTQLCGVNNDINIYATIQQQL